MKNIKEERKKTKSFFLIINLILSLIAFSWIVGAQQTDPPSTTNNKIEVTLIDERKITDTIVSVKKPVDLKIINDEASFSYENVDGVDLENNIIHFKDGKTEPVSPEVAEAVGDKLKSSQTPTSLNTKAIIDNALKIGMLFGLGYMIGGLIGDNADVSLGSALAVAGVVWQAQAGEFGGPGSVIKEIANGIDNFVFEGFSGVAVGAILFLLLYKKESQEVVEFNCLPYEPPIGGNDCELCNDDDLIECSEYRCKSLGQACELLNQGSENEACTWVNPHDVNSPIIKMGSVLKGYIYKPDSAVRPPATGVVISQRNGDCVEAFTPLEFTILTDEPSQCRIDYNLTREFDEMSYYFGGSNLFSYNHTEIMSLPGPNAINAAAPELKNDGTYTLYTRCRDANGNFNQDAFSVRFCVNPGPDTTPPRIEDISIPSNSPVQYNISKIDIEVYVNEPAECKWGRENRRFEDLENEMECSTNLWEMNNRNVYTCKTTLTGIENRKENDFYFRCKDQPNAEEGDRNSNNEGYKYTLIGTQPLNILRVEPNGTIRGATETVPVFLGIETDNGYDDGNAMCYYYNDVNNNAPASDEDYLQFLDTGTNIHKQRQDLTSGIYVYYYKCVDLGGNADYSSTTFTVDVDTNPPVIVRAYKEGDLKIITNEKSTCSYSTKDCNFNIEDGIAMPYDNEKVHNVEWKVSHNYYIRCKDEYNNQADPNTCTMIVRPFDIVEEGNVIEL